MSLRAISWAMETPCPSPTAKLVLLTLADAHNGHTGECFPSLGRIVEITGLSESGVKGAIRALEAEGLLSRHVQNDDTGRTKGVRYELACEGGRGRQETPRGREKTPEGAPGNPTRGRQETPLIDEPEKEPEREPEVTRDKRASHTDFPTKAFETWYEGYPHKVGRQAAEKAFERVRKGGQVSFAKLVAGRDHYIATKPHHVEWCNPATWLNQGRWDDAPAINTQGAIHGQPANRNHRTHSPARPEGTAARVAAIMGYGSEPDVHGSAEERRIPGRPAWPEGGDTSRIIDAQPLRAGLYRA